MFVTDLVNTRLVNLTFVYIKKAVNSELRGEKGPGLSIDSMLKKKFKLNLMSFVRNLNWPGRGFELGATEKQIQVLSVTAGLQLGTTGLRVHHAGHWAG